MAPFLVLLHSGLLLLRVDVEFHILNNSCPSGFPGALIFLVHSSQILCKNPDGSYSFSERIHAILHNMIV